MDNRIFNVNGRGSELLTQALILAFAQVGEKSKAVAWRFLPEKGFILLWSRNTGSMAFPVPIDAQQAAPMVLQWLDSDEARTVPKEGWDANASHDGHNSLGWRVYVEDWGHVGAEDGVICAIRPAYMWHGK